MEIKVICGTNHFLIEEKLKRIKENSLGLSGFIVKKMNSTYHYLVRFSLKPGLKDTRLTCTVRTSDAKSCLTNKNYSSLKDNDLMKYYIMKF